MLCIIFTSGIKIGSVASVEVRKFCVIIFHKIKQIYMIVHNNLIHERYKGFVYPLAIILLNVYCKCRFTLSFREIEEMHRIRGLFIDHSTLHRWMIAFTPLLEQEFKKRKKPVGNSWRMDETYIKIKGVWYYLYRALDKLGNTVDFLLLENRDTQAAKTFFRKAFKNNNVPFVINVDKSGANKAALDSFNEELGEENAIEIRQCKYLNNIIEQDHRFIKKRLKPILWLKSVEGATAVISGIELVQMLKKGQMKGINDNKATYDQFVSLAA